MQRPAAADFAPYFHAYVGRVPDGDLLATLRRQAEATAALLAPLDDDRAQHRYAPGKWSVKQVLNHLIDTERVMCVRALYFARGSDVPLPGMDENVFAQHDAADARPLASLLDEFRSVRAATLSLFGGFDGAAWARRGIANANPFTVSSLAWIVAGHELHHVAMLRERYGVG